MDIPGCKGRENTVVSDIRKHTRPEVTTAVVKEADQPHHSLVVSYSRTYVGLVCLLFLPYPKHLHGTRFFSKYVQLI